MTEMRLSPSTNLEQYTFAVLLLKVFMVFGLLVGITDYLNCDHLTASKDLFISIYAITVLLHSRNADQAALLQQLATVMLVSMCLVGIYTMLPYQQEKLVWANLYPFAFFYLTGLRRGLLISLFCAISIPISYEIFPLFSNASRISQSSLLQTLGAFSLCIVLGYQYEKIRARQSSQLQHLAERDPLTGLLNRRGFQAVARTITDAASRLQKTYAIVMIDLDNLNRSTTNMAMTVATNCCKRLPCCCYSRPAPMTL